MRPDSLMTLIQNRSTSMEAFTPNSLQFPLARQNEVHWLIRGFETSKGRIDEVVCVFADSVLVFVQGRGGIQRILQQLPDLKFDAYQDYRFSQKAALVIHPEDDTAWKLDDMGFHMNLFAWDHPMLDKDFKTWPAYRAGVDIPDFIEMGGDLNTLSPRMEAASRFVYREELDGSDPNAQLQLNCFGVGFAGFPRKIEARFGDGKLNTVWILTAKAEEERLRAQMRELYGEPIFVSESWEAFADWQVFLRKDKPEILLLTPELGYYYRDNYFKE